jgi:hypothetical protein
MCCCALRQFVYFYWASVLPIPHLTASPNPLADIVEKLNVNKEFLQKSNLNKIFVNGGK